MVPPSKFIKCSALPTWKSQNTMIIDVRSPSEFEEDHIPGAINLPVLSDDERARVGTLYKDDNFEAKKVGARLISKNISLILEVLDEIDLRFKSPGQRKPDLAYIVYCWRGGMRSTSLFTVMDLIGYRTFVLDGGYRAYRQWINEYLKNLTLSRVIVLHGPSGTGKTNILEQLGGEGVYPINLEKLANHSGSVFGGRETNQPSQKLFETKLVEVLLKSKSEDIVIFEGESRKIGKLTLPKTLNDILLNAKRIWVELPLEVRAAHIASEYHFSKEDFKEKLSFFRRFISSRILKEIETSFQNKDYFQVSKLFLQHHYDPLYQKSYRLKKHPEEIILIANSREYLLEKIRLSINED